MSEEKINKNADVLEAKEIDEKNVAEVSGGEGTVNSYLDLQASLSLFERSLNTSQANHDISNNLRNVLFSERGEP